MLIVRCSTKIHMITAFGSCEWRNKFAFRQVKCRLSPPLCGDLPARERERDAQYLSRAYNSVASEWVRERHLRRKEKRDGSGLSRKSISCIAPLRGRFFFLVCVLF